MIRYSTAFQKNQPAKFDGLFDWDFLKECWYPTKIEPTDIDAVVERNSKFLFFETKNVGKKMEDGYRIMMENLLKSLRGNGHLLYFHGKNGLAVTDLEEWEIDKRSGLLIKHPKIECDCDHLIRRASNWFKWANGQGNFCYEK